MWAYTRNKRLKIVLTTSWKLFGNGAPATQNNHLKSLYALI